MSEDNAVAPSLSPSHTWTNFTSLFGMSTAPSPSQELPVSHLPSSPSQLLTSPSIESVVAPATASCPPAPGNLKDLLCHSDILLDCHEWFHLLQDDGIEMSSTNKEIYLPMNLKPKKRHR